MPMTGVGGVVPDELLRMTGSTTTWFETYTTTTNESGAYVGQNEVEFRLIVTAIGVTSGTTTDYSATVKFQDSSDGTTYTDMGISYPAVNAALGDSFAAVGNAVEFARQTVRTRTGRPYLRPVITMGGTNPTVTLALVPAPSGARAG